MGRPKKEPYSDLEETFKDSVDSMSSDEVKMKIAEIALAQEALNEAKKEDQDLQERKDAYDVANEPYKDAAKSNKLRIAYCHSILRSRGVVE